MGAPGNEPVLCWKLKHKTLLASLIPLATGDVFGLPNYTTLLLGYTKEKGYRFISRLLHTITLFIQFKALNADMNESLLRY